MANLNPALLKDKEDGFLKIKYFTYFLLNGYLSQLSHVWNGGNQEAYRFFKISEVFLNF